MQSQLVRIANQRENLTSLDAMTSVDFEQKTSNEQPSVTENRQSYMVSEARSEPARLCRPIELTSEELSRRPTLQLPGLLLAQRCRADWKGR